VKRLWLILIAAASIAGLRSAAADTRASAGTSAVESSGGAVASALPLAAMISSAPALVTASLSISLPLLVTSRQKPFSPVMGAAV